MAADLTKLADALKGVDERLTRMENQRADEAWARKDSPTRAEVLTEAGRFHAKAEEAAKAGRTADAKRHREHAEQLTKYAKTL